MWHYGTIWEDIEKKLLWLQIFKMNYISELLVEHQEQVFN